MDVEKRITYSMAAKSIEGIAAQLYRIFSAYSSDGVDFCGHCHDEDDIKHYVETAIQNLEPDRARVLFWESSDRRRASAASSAAISRHARAGIDWIDNTNVGTVNATP